MKPNFVGLMLAGCLFIGFGFWQDIAILTCLGGIVLGGSAIGWIQHKEIVDLYGVVRVQDLLIGDLHVRQVIARNQQETRQPEESEIDSADWWKTGKDWYGSN